MKYSLRSLLLAALFLPPLAGVLWPLSTRLYRSYLDSGQTPAAAPQPALKKTPASSAQFIWRDADGNTHVIRQTGPADDLPNP